MPIFERKLLLIRSESLIRSEVHDTVKIKNKIQTYRKTKLDGSDPAFRSSKDPHLNLKSLKVYYIYVKVEILGISGKSIRF